MFAIVAIAFVAIVSNAEVPATPIDNAPTVVAVDASRSGGDRAGAASRGAAHGRETPASRGTAR